MTGRRWRGAVLGVLLATAVACGGPAVGERPPSATVDDPRDTGPRGAGPLDDGPPDGEDGDLQERVSPFDTDEAAVARLDPDLRRALQAAAADAADDGVRLEVTSGWRSETYQRQLFAEAVARYGSEQAARRFVADPEVSRHVTGRAVDVGPTDATSWLSQHGDDYGLCQTYANEMWHFELATTPGGECPEMRPDASQG